MRSNSIAPSATDPGKRGFTLVELLIVVSIIAILASIAVPNYLTSKVRAGEAAVVQMMKNVATGQYLLRTRVAVDMNRDGASEHGFLGELSGLAPLRGSGNYLKPPLLSPGFVFIDPEGFGDRSGYVFCLYLPNASGVGIPEKAALLAQVDPGLASHYYTLLAWPASYGSTGQRTFFMNQGGEIVETVDSNYSGRNSAPISNAALIGVPKGVITTNSIAVAGQVGVDGNRWKTVR